MKKRIHSYSCCAIIFIAIYFAASSFMVVAGECEPRFDHFMLDFESDQQFQLDSIKYPLAYHFVDANADPEPVVVIKSLTRQDVVNSNMSLYPSAIIQQERGLVRELIVNTDGMKKLRLSKPDTDYVLDYSFEFITGCWKLLVFEDHSL